MTTPTKREISAVFKKFKCDKGAMHGYDIMYESVFGKIGAPSKLLEVGFRRGRSAASWAELFPQADLSFIDIALRDDVIPEAQGMKVIECNSARTKVQELVDSDYDVIIDDGDHRPDFQWQTFMNLENRWKKAYIIEDVIGRENLELLRKRLISKGYRNIHSFSSKLSDGVVRTNGVDVATPFFSIAVYPNASM